jgi:hypothetical protein
MKRLTNILASIKAFFIRLVTKRFSLKSGDNVWVFIVSKKKSISKQQAEIEGFRAYGICYTNHPVKWHHYANGLFYGFGYHSDAYAIVTFKKWHFYFAFVLEKIRVKMPINLAIWLRLES